MSYSDDDVFAATAALDKYRGGVEGEIGSALAVVGLSAARIPKEARIRDDIGCSWPFYVLSPAYDLGERIAAYWLLSM